MNDHLEQFQQIAITMTGVDEWEEIPLRIRHALSDAATCVARATGTLRSRQTIAAIIALSSEPAAKKKSAIKKPKK